MAWYDLAFTEDAKRILGLAQSILGFDIEALTGGTPPGLQGNVFMTLASDDGVLSYHFSVGTAVYATLTRDANYTWATQERIGRSPARQFMGPGDQTISLPCTVYTQLAGGFSQPGALRALAGYGRPLVMTDFFGYVHGLWVVTKVSEQQSAFLADTTPQKQEITLELSWYGEDFEAGAQPYSATQANDAVGVDDSAWGREARW